MTVLFVFFVAVPFITVGALATFADPDVARFLHKAAANLNVLFGRFDRALVCYTMACVSVDDWRSESPTYTDGPYLLGQALPKHNAPTQISVPRLLTA